MSNVCLCKLPDVRGEVVTVYKLYLISVYASEQANTDGIGVRKAKNNFQSTDGSPRYCANPYYFLPWLEKIQLPSPQNSNFCGSVFKVLVRQTTCSPVKTSFPQFLSILPF